MSGQFNDLPCFFTMELNFKFYKLFSKKINLKSIYNYVILISEQYIQLDEKCPLLFNNIII